MEGGPEGQEVDLRRWLSGVVRRKTLVLAIVVGLVGAALLLSAVQTPVYRAEAQILIQPGASESLFDTQGSSVQPNADVRIDTEIQVLKGKPVRASVVEKLGT